MCVKMLTMQKVDECWKRICTLAQVLRSVFYKEHLFKCSKSPYHVLIKGQFTTAK